MPIKMATIPIARIEFAHLSPTIFLNAICKRKRRIIARTMKEALSFKKNKKLKNQLGVGGEIVIKGCITLPLGQRIVTL